MTARAASGADRRNARFWEVAGQNRWETGFGSWLVGRPLRLKKRVGSSLQLARAPTGLGEQMLDLVGRESDPRAVQTHGAEMHALRRVQRVPSLYGIHALCSGEVLSLGGKICSSGKWLAASQCDPAVVDKPAQKILQVGAKLFGLQPLHFVEQQDRRSSRTACFSWRRSGFGTGRPNSPSTSLQKSCLSIVDWRLTKTTG